MNRSSRPALWALNSSTGKPAAIEAADERHLLVVAAVELELHAPAGLVDVQHAGLFEQESLDAVVAPGETHGQDPPPAHALEDVLHRAGRQDPALLDHRHDVAHLGQLGQDVGAEEDRLAVGGQLADQRAELDARARIEVGGRLVEDEQLRIVNDGAAERDALLEALGEALDVAVPEIADAHELDDVRDRLAPRRRRADRRRARRSRDTRSTVVFA